MIIALAWLFAGAASPAAAQVDNCPNAELRAKQGATHLPDCRAYELVSPAKKLGGAVGNTNQAIPQAQIALDGDHVAYWGFYPFAEANGGSLSGYLSSRNDDWSTIGLLPVPGTNQIGGGFPGAEAYLLGSTPDTRTSVYYDTTTEPHGSLWVVKEDGTRVRIADASVTPVFGSIMDLMGGYPGQPWFEGISADGSTVVFGSTDALLPGVSESGEEILYVWRDDGSNGGAGSLDVVNRTSEPNLTLVDSGASATLGGSVKHAYPNMVNDHGLQNAISSDGTRIYFQTPPPVSVSTMPAGGGPLYMREGTVTTEVSAPSPGHTPTSAPTKVQYLDASPDGRYSFFWADGDLTPDAPAAGGIYRYDVHTQSLAFAAPSSMTQETTAMASSNGDRLYFQDGPTLKLYDDGEVSVVFNGVVGYPFGAGSSPLPRLSSQQCVTAGMTDNGRFLAFSGTSAGAHQVYRYDAAEDQLTHISVSPHDPTTYRAGWTAPGCQLLGPANRVSAQVMSADGEYVFFEASGALVPGDSNSANDVYQWHDGAVSLISTGSGARGSVFIGTDETAKNVFTVTDGSLVHADPDTVFDIYTARVNGGIPTQNQTPSAPCEGDECQGDATAPPPDPDMGSSGHQGSGNPDHAAPDCTSDRRELKQARKKLRKARRKASRLTHKARRADRSSKSKWLRREAKRIKRQAKRQLKQAKRELLVCKRGEAS